MVKTVVREFKFEPRKIDKLYTDDSDYLGLGYWYKDALAIEKELKKGK